MRMARPRPSSLFLVLTVLVGITGLAQIVVKSRRAAGGTAHGEVIHETRSEYSRIRVREIDRVRRLLFVDDAGDEYCQSAIDLDHPATLQHGYAKGMFASLLFRERQDRVLIVGLGGGGMVRFLNERLPATLVEAVEIDPVVVDIAAEYFGVAEGPRTRIHTADAFTFFDAPRDAFDAIYLDAFLRAPESAGLGRDDRTAQNRGLSRDPAIPSEGGRGGRVQSHRGRSAHRRGSRLDPCGSFPEWSALTFPGRGIWSSSPHARGTVRPAKKLIRRGGRLDGVFQDLGFSLEEIARNRAD